VSLASQKLHLKNMSIFRHQLNLIIISLKMKNVKPIFLSPLKCRNFWDHIFSHSSFGIPTTSLLIHKKHKFPQLTEWK